MYKKPRGTRDFDSEEMQKRQYVKESIRSTFESYNYKEIQTPTLETLKIFTAKSGEEIIKEIYSFTDKSGRNLALRPELTAPVIRFYVNNLQMEPKPLKLFYFGNCFRYDRPQKGRYREFLQAGCEIIGVETPESQAELISLAYMILDNLGLKDIKLNIGNLNLLSSIFEKIKIDKEKQKYLIPLIDKEEYEEVYNALQDFNINPKNITDFLDIIQTDDLNKIKNYLKNDKKALEIISKQEEIFNYLKNDYNIPNFFLKMSIVRGLDYYKGLVFEIEAPKLGAEKQICGGGKYELIPLFGGRPTPTAGFAIGFDRTIIALESEKHDFPIKKTDAYIIPIDKKMINISIKIAQKLRKQKIKVDIDLLRRGISKSLKYASSIKTKKAIIIGPDEIEKKSVTIRDMKTGEQKIVPIKDITKEF